MNLIYTDPESNGKLFQSSKYAIPKIIKENNISILILAAKEYQPRSFDGIVKFYVPLDDSDAISHSELLQIKRIAILAALAIKNGSNILSTCHQGRNRSGLITGFILKILTGCNGNQAIKHIKNKRPFALTNDFFQKLLILNEKSQKHHQSYS